MPEATDDRRGELVAAALAGDLSSAERAELERLKHADPSIETELDEMRSLTGMLARSAPAWLEEEPSPQLRDRVAGLATAGADDGVTAPAHRDPSTSRFRRGVRTVLGAAACVAVGVGLAAGAYSISTAPPTGPPGTLGAVEEVDFAVDPSGVEVEGALIAHTWGTETVMEIDGLPAEESYALVLIAPDGTEFDSGTFFGSNVTIECRMNAAVMRHDVTRVEIRDDDGAVVSAAEVPEAVEA